jgi:hypothetical protein
MVERDSAQGVREMSIARILRVADHCGAFDVDCTVEVMNAEGG